MKIGSFLLLGFGIGAIVSTIFWKGVRNEERDLFSVYYANADNVRHSALIIQSFKTRGENLSLGQFRREGQTCAEPRAGHPDLQY